MSALYLGLTHNLFYLSLYIIMTVGGKVCYATIAYK